LKERARRGDEAVASQGRERREAVVGAAVVDGRIPPARRQAWLKMLEADADAATEVLASLPRGRIPSVSRSATSAASPRATTYTCPCSAGDAGALTTRRGDRAS
jgi:hypothetical protein